MRKPLRALPVLAVLLLSSPALGVEARDAEERGEADRISERIRLHLARHGENGVLDPAKLLRGVASVHADLTARRPAWSDAVTPAWLSIGPTNGAGRMTAVAPHPTLAGTVYAGAAGGGVWKTADGGVTWAPLTDALGDLSAGAVALAPSAPNVVYVGTGEGGMVGDWIPGFGLVKSTDGGATWSLPVDVAASMFYRISVHPANPNELLAGTNRGVLRSTDGGATFAATLAGAGDAVEVLRHPANPSVVWAGLWCNQACTSASTLVRKSTDGGVTWAASSTGLPALGSLTNAYHTRPALAVSRSSPQVLYLSTAVTDPSSGAPMSHVYKSTDGGATWSDLPGISGSSNFILRQFHQWQAAYDNVIAVSPTDPNVVLAGGVYYVRSTDGGATWALPHDVPHPDVHDVVYQGATLWMANDGGIWTSADGGDTYTARNTGLVTFQFYGLENDPTNPLRVMGGTQDNGSWMRRGAGTEWTNFVGGDGIQCGVNAAVPEVVYGTAMGSLAFRSMNAGDPYRYFNFVGPWLPSSEIAAFFALVTVDPLVPSTLFTASMYRVWRSTDGGDSWLPLSTTMADGSAWYGLRTYSDHWISSIARSRANPSLLMISWSKGGRVLRSTDGGTTWRNASSGLPASGINNLEIDRTNPDLVFAAVATQSGAGVYRSTDGGGSWQQRSGGLPPFAAQVVRIDPADANVVYCGTDVGVYRSADQGGSWSRFGTGLPAASVYDLRITDDGSIFRAATHGRGVWELQQPASSNHAPAAMISSPAAAVTVAKGTTVVFTGSTSDPDAGDAVSASWNVTDTWSSFPVAQGASSFAHTFARAGTFPVSLAARDAHGARAAAVVLVTVQEPADSCATPIVIPPAGPFPYTVSVSGDAATNAPTDPTASCYPYSVANSLWFEFTPAVSGTYEISTCGATVRNALSVYTGPACGPYAPVAGACTVNAASGGCPVSTPGYTTPDSFLSVPLTAGQTVRIEAQSPSAAYRGPFPLTISRPPSSLAPRVSSVSPFSGAPAGGTPVTVTGFNFTDGAVVSFGGTSAPATVVNPMVLVATAPAHAAGSVDVAVRNPDAATGTAARAFTYGASTGGVTCTPNASTLCLLGNRFAVTADWADYGGNRGHGAAVALTADTGYFWFFSSTNVETVVKMVSFCGGGSDRVGVYAGGLTDLDVTLHVTDMRSGVTKDYRNPLGTLFQLVRDGPFDCPALLAPDVPPVTAPDAAVPFGATASCVPNATTLCLLDGRFQVRAAYRDYGGGTGAGQASPLTSDTGSFWFFDSRNVEVVAKFVSFCGSGSNNVGIYATGLTDLEVTLTVVDTLTGLTKSYTNALGSAFRPVRDGPFSCR